MKFTIEINIDNAAFHNDVVLLGDDEATNVCAPFREIRRILIDQLPGSNETLGYGEFANVVSPFSMLKDSNGNTVGSWRIEEEK